MSITFPSGLIKPSNVTAFPGNFIRPAFEELYGFDTPQGPPPFFDDTLSFPTIQVFGTQVEITNDVEAPPDFTIVHAKDTDRLLVWDGSVWVLFNRD
jgi:hypothetical protein